MTDEMKNAISSKAPLVIHLAASIHLVPFIAAVIFFSNGDWVNITSFLQGYLPVELYTMIALVSIYSRRDAGRVIAMWLPYIAAIVGLIIYSQLSLETLWYAAQSFAYALITFLAGFLLASRPAKRWYGSHF